MKIHSASIELHTEGRGTYEFTGRLQELVRNAGIRQGVCHLYLQHTSASLLINENADPDVQRDLDAFFERLVPDGDPLFVHRAEGPDDMPAHIRSALTQTSLSIPIVDGVCALGTWQGVFLWEHRYRAHRRVCQLTLIGE